MSPIEHIWNVLGLPGAQQTPALQHFGTAWPRSIALALQEEGQLIPREIIHSVITSMPRGRRCHACRPDTDPLCVYIHIAYAVEVTSIAFIRNVYTHRSLLLSI